MSFREVQVYEIREVLRLWLRGEGQRTIARLVMLDRKTVRRYVEAAQAAGLGRDDAEERLGDELIGAVCEAVRPKRLNGRGESWELLVRHHDQLKGWLVDKGLTAVKAHELLARQGVVVPERTVHRYALEVLEVGRSVRASTLRVADGEPGSEPQVDFGRMGLLADPETGRRRVCWALIFTACWSRHCFVWLSFTQSTEATIAGFEAAWAFFGGVFKVVIPTTWRRWWIGPTPWSPGSTRPSGSTPRPGLRRRPGPGGHPHRQAPGGADGAVRAQLLLRRRGVRGPGRRPAPGRGVVPHQGRPALHGTTQCRPAETFTAEEQPRLLAAPAGAYDLPHYAVAKVHRDHHIEVAKALYSVPGNLIGSRVQVRADRQLVRISHRGVLIKVHPRTRPGGRVTDAADLPAEKTTYALRDLEHLTRLAAGHGPAIGAFAAVLLDHPLPWTKMRQVYALLGLVKRWGPERVEAACGRALEAEAVNVGLIARMIERAVEAAGDHHAPAATASTARFARQPEHFATAKAKASPSGGAA